VNTKINLRVPCKAGNFFISEGLSAFQEGLWYVELVITSINKHHESFNA